MNKNRDYIEEEEDDDFNDPIQFFRGRRLRQNPFMREMLRETRLHPSELVMPYFVVDTDDRNFNAPIQAMPGQFQFSIQELEKQVQKAVNNGLRSVILFGIPKKKDARGSEAYAKHGIVQNAIYALKKRFPDLQIITDVCLCEYTSHGHCGIVSEQKNKTIILNDASLELLAKTALSHVEAGADMVAPSDMMDGRVLTIRAALDAEGFENTPIMSYAVKYASALYGPFREAAGSAPQFGDRKSYQMDPANSHEAMLEASADEEEGADILMVKPASYYLDIIRTLADNFDRPIAAYQVSGEYSMIKAAGKENWIDENAVVLESLLSIKRAGAKLIISYFTEDLLAKKLIG